MPNQHDQEHQEQLIGLEVEQRSALDGRPDSVYQQPSEALSAAGFRTENEIEVREPSSNSDDEEKSTPKKSSPTPL